jgi:hypothetical protein
MNLNLKSPGKSFIQMYKLICEHRVNRLKEIFTDELLLAICWEETFFNNVYQRGGGTAIGFGQTEPGEFPKLKSDEAIQKGYYVQGLPDPVYTRNSKGKVIKAASPRPLTDRESIQAQSAMLCHLYLRGLNRRDALEAYGGVPWSWAIEQQVKTGAMTRQDALKIDPLGPYQRIRLIDGWVACEKKLIAEYAFEYVESRKTVREALLLAKQYPVGSSTWEQILFPEPEGSWWDD